MSRVWSCATLAEGAQHVMDDSMLANAGPEQLAEAEREIQRQIQATFLQNVAGKHVVSVPRSGQNLGASV